MRKILALLVSIVMVIAMFSCAIAETTTELDENGNLIANRQSEKNLDNTKCDKGIPEKEPVSMSIAQLIKDIAKTADEIRNTNTIIAAAADESLNDIISQSLSNNNLQEALNMLTEAYGSADLYETRLDFQNQIATGYDNLIQQLIMEVKENGQYEIDQETLTAIYQQLTRQRVKDAIIAAWTDSYIAAHNKKLIEFKIAVQLILDQQAADQARIEENIKDALRKYIEEIFGKMNKILEDTKKDLVDDALTCEKSAEDIFKNLKENIDSALALEEFLNEYTNAHPNDEFTKELLDYLTKCIDNSGYGE